eukprot:2916466-Pyramimonas_sp.AAC.1
MEWLNKVLMSTSSPTYTPCRAVPADPDGPHLHARAVLQQQLHELDRPAGGGGVQQAEPPGGARARIGTPLQQQLGGVHMPKGHRVVQRGPPALGAVVHVRARVD